MPEWKQVKLDLLEDLNYTLPERVEAVALHIYNFAQAQCHWDGQTHQMGGGWCASPLHHIDEYHAKRTGWTRLFFLKGCLDGLLSRYAQADPIAQNLAQTRLYARRFVENGGKTLPSHIAKLQRLWEACSRLGVGITNALFTGVITLSMPTPSWDPVIGTLGGVLDPKIVNSCLNTEWSRRQGLTSTSKDRNVVFQNWQQIVDEMRQL